ncbi:MAG: thioredoxin domain-containing protein, partial [Cyclobacteriaceae bacterium]|nr:thioredoxin domain-containing protein [Cyclobacteriaceae bacterium HetDA_MAG_MS6]
MTEPSFTNELIHSSSPYLLQHANNPVRWQEWNSKSLQQALDQNKPILVSIGYSSCHWCHVMAHESFEDEEVAAIMNEHFVNIKIDREERPDVDQIYMDAVQAMGLRGGWPLNVFLTPDQKPFYGGTYFPKENWKKLLGEVARAYRENEEKLSESADKIAESLIDDFTKKYGLSTENAPLSGDDFQELYKKLEIKFDSEWGGILKEPKFPMPSVWQFLLHFQQLENHQEARKHFLFTLNKIANGGIYDHIGGGFARYSVDGEWHVPHFEKMLYDNGQLLSLYANAYKLTASPLYKDVIMETASWLKREMTHKNGGFYAALDADSEGVEGKFYVWTEQQVNELTDNQELIKTYFNITAQGNWEHGNNVLRRIIDQNEVIEKFNVSATELHEIISDFKEQALKERDKRIRPGLDNKIIAGWNGLMLSGLIDAYQATREESLLVLAKANAEFISGSLVKDGSLLRIAGLNTQGFMEDYSAVIQAFIKYYETTFEESYLEFAKVLTDQALDEFFDK